MATSITFCLGQKYKSLAFNTKDSDHIDDARCLLCFMPEIQLI